VFPAEMPEFRNLRRVEDSSKKYLDPQFANRESAAGVSPGSWLTGRGISSRSLWISNIPGARKCATVAAYRYILDNIIS
jgi:hypothetical protein